MTYWIVTTGDSLRTSSRCWKLPGQERLYEHDDQPMAAFLDPSIINDGLSELLTWQQRRREIIDDAMGQDPSAFQNRAAELVKQFFRSECWTDGRRHTLPAELATLHLLRGRLSGSDTLQLVTGRSNLRVAQLLAAVLKQVSSAGELAIPADKILCDPCYDLDPSDTQAFRAGIITLWQDIHHLLEKHIDVRLVLTGGFKAIAIALAYLVGREVSIRTPMYYLYESTDSQVVEISFGTDVVSPEPDITLIPGV